MVEAHSPTGNPPISRYGPKFLKKPNFVWEIGFFRDFCHAPPVPHCTPIFTARSGPMGANIRLKFQAPTRHSSLAFCAPFSPGKHFFYQGDFVFLITRSGNHQNGWFLSHFATMAVGNLPSKREFLIVNRFPKKSPVSIWRFFEKSGDFLFGQVFLSKKDPAQ